MPETIPVTDELRGLWRRSLIAWPDGARDTTTNVRWLQGLRIYVDLRQPSDLPPMRHARGLADLGPDDCAWLARQEGFAGHFTFDGAWFEWSRTIDFQPKPLYSDAGSLGWQDEVLVERGRDVTYVEHWHRNGALPTQPVGAAWLRDIARGTTGVLLRVGPHFMLARDRAVVPPEQLTLAECVAAAGSLEEARALVDCEISFGVASSTSFRITASSLPYRVGDTLGPRRAGDTLATADRAPDGSAMTRLWSIIAAEGEPRALDSTRAALSQFDEVLG